NNEPQTIELGPVPGAPQSSLPQPGEQPMEAVQPVDQAQPRQEFSQQELDQMLAPIALYPDALLSQILMASTYPIEVVQAARWSKANPGIGGDQAVRTVEQQPWDPSVKSLVAFPNVLSMMDEKLDWMERLGDAFLSQEQAVMGTVQQLRQKAQAAGNLQSNNNIVVQPQGQTIVIEQANPQIVYVPYYDPTIVYGPWWYPAYPPVFWRPWPGYYARPGFGPGFFWGSGITISTGFFFGRVDWPRRNVTVVNVNNYYYRAPPPRPNFPPGAWVHDPAHRRGVPYRDPEVRREFGGPRVDGRPESRRDFRGNPLGATGPGARPSAVNRPQVREAPERVAPRPNNPAPANREQPDRGERRDSNVQAPPRVPAAPVNRPDAREVPQANNPAPANREQPGRGEQRDSAGQAPPRVPAAPVNRPNAPEGPQSNAPAPPNRPNVTQGAPRAAPAQPARVAPARPPTESRPQVFDGVGQGAKVRDSSARGRASFERMSPSNPGAAARPQAPAAAPRPAARPAPAPRQQGENRGNDGPRQQR
ncbi:MAG: DUF3300 domain-containing protein, partial [Betaproteobacteria bacterium]